MDSKNELNILALGDPHLEEPEDCNIEPLESYLENNPEIEIITILGDVIDTVPNKRKAEDREIAINFYKQIEGITDENTEVAAISGNHDYDIHDDVIDEIQGITNLDHSYINIGTYTLAGWGTSRFDLGTEIPFWKHPQYSEKKDYERDIFHEEILDSDPSEMREILKSNGDNLNIDKDIERYEKLLERKRELTDQDMTVYINHIPPFYTSLDYNSEFDAYNGSMSDRQILDRPEIIASISGHRHNESFEYLEESGTPCLGPGKRQIARATIDNNEFSYEPLNEPQI